ncbi:MAG: glutamate--tRNA ligase [Alphaproteobacteria bacterium]|nr:glutamate--tRNA ligase [Alphaproteobacteria bacterium]MBE8219869.1 glutamate--tRNA ligase [Alphaproteobacteria bacterium]
MVITRFAPSPTGFLHIGGARTALFCWAYARHHKGQFLLRIEDTDRNRSGEAETTAILDSLAWLGLNYDGDIVYQHKNAARHNEIAATLLENGNAYKCSCAPEEVEAMREKARAAGTPPRYDGTCRNGGYDDTKPYVIRFKSPQTGTTQINDVVKGDVAFACDQFDDVVLVRSDNTPTYMLSVVVDDHDMGITHIIRGDDHFTNAARQKQIYEAMDWQVPDFAHLPLIHGADGAKLSKRHGALGVGEYKDDGYLPEAMCNYLARLGWAHGDDETFTRQQFCEWFSLEAIGKSPARFDMDKLNFINAYHIKNSDDDALLAQLDLPTEKIKGAMALLKDRATTLGDIKNEAAFLLAPPIIEPEAAEKLTPEALVHLRALHDVFAALTDWQRDPIEAALRDYLKAHDIKMGAIGPAIRVAITGKVQSLGIFDVLALLPQAEILARLSAQSSEK